MPDLKPRDKSRTIIETEKKKRNDDTKGFIANPYLAIAQHYDVSDGHVLSYSDHIEFGGDTYWRQQARKALSRDVKMAVLKAVNQEMKRREQVLNAMS